MSQPYIIQMSLELTNINQALLRGTVNPDGSHRVKANLILFKDKAGSGGGRVKQACPINLRNQGYSCPIVGAWNYSPLAMYRPGVLLPEYQYEARDIE